MPTIVLDLLKYVFLAVLYIFVARAVRAVYQELRPAKTPRAAPAGPRPKQPRRSGKTPGHVRVLEGEGGKSRTIPLDGEILIGRADKCHLVIEDTYASQIHARIFERNGSIMVEDMGSTNGTYLNRQKVTAPTEVFRGDKVKVGKTVLEFRK